MKKVQQLEYREWHPVGSKKSYSLEGREGVKTAELNIAIGDGWRTAILLMPLH